MTTIEWTNKTWNPLVGCSKISEGCRNCYAIKEAHRLAGNPNPKISSVYQGLTERRGDRTEWTGLVKFIPERLEVPLKTRKPTMWFVNSMSDLFHESVTDEQIARIWDVMAATPQHVYQVLTKRPQRMLEWVKRCSHHPQQWSITHNGNQPMPYGDGIIVGDAEKWPLPNVWLGVTVENQKAADERIPLLLQTPAAVRFLSCEPLLEEVDLQLWARQTLKGLQLEGLPQQGEIVEPGIDWVIVGGESGSKARECHTHWIQSLVRQCNDAHIPCFVKQMGSNCLTSQEHSQGIAWPPPGKGGDITQFPKDLQVRQFPQFQQEPA